MAEASSLAVYDGRTRLGSIQRQGSKHVAQDADGKRIGSFSSQAEAKQAITAGREARS